MSAGDSTILCTRHPIQAALIVVSDSPLHVGGRYLFIWSHMKVIGQIQSIGPKLLSPFAEQSSKWSLFSGELASLEIEALLPGQIGISVQSTREIVVVDPHAKETLARGLVIPACRAEQDFRRESYDGLTVWLTGLSGAGKTTIARHLQARLRERHAVELLDADIVRTCLCKDLGFSSEDRNENVRRLGFVASLLNQRGILVLVTAISPYRAVRDEVRRRIVRFVEVFVNAPISTCEMRDVKGLYKKVRAGEITSFTGIDQTYEPPLAPEVECCTDRESIETSVLKVIAVVERALDIRDP